MVVALLGLAPPASADHSFCLYGSGAGECVEPEGIAVEEESGRVYVVDRGNDRIDVFQADGTFLFAFGWGVDDGSGALQKCTTASGCQAGLSGAGAGQFAAPTSIAIDNEPLSPSYRSIYVGTDNFRVQKFDREGNFLLAFGSAGTGSGQFGSASAPIAVAGSSGDVYVGDPRSVVGGFDPRIVRFGPTGSPLGSCELPVPNARLFGLAVDSGSDVYAVFDEAGNGVRKYEWGEPDCAVLANIDAGTQTRRAIAVDGADDFYALQDSGSAGLFITKYDGAGAKLSRFGYGQIEAVLRGLAANSATGDLFGSEPFVGSTVPGVGNKVIHVDSPSPGPLVVSAEADPISNTKATLNGAINPEGEVSTYHFEYVDEATYLADIAANGPGHGFDSAERVPEEAGDDQAVGSPGDFELRSATSTQIGCPNPAVEADDPGSKCLIPDTDYRFRLVAENADGQGEAEAEFHTGPPIEIQATWSTEVGPDSARLHATVNPLGVPAVGHFEYIDDATYQVSNFDEAKQSSEIDFGSGEVGKSGSFFLAELASGTYHFRIVVDNPLIEPLAGPERTFATQEAPIASLPCPNDEFRTGPSAFLPNCRAYEMVSPVDKENGDIVTVGNINSNPAQLNQSAATGERFTYSSYRAFGDAQSAPFTSQYMATRSGQGWLSHGISPPRGVNILFLGGTLDTEFKAFSEDLCTGWLRHDTDPALAPSAPEGFANLYRRDNCPPAADTYATITTVSPPTREASHYAPELQGVSADGSHAVFRAEDALTGTANPGKKPTGSNFQCYDQSGTSLRLVSILPNGAASKSNCSVGTSYDVNDGRSDAVSHAISDDGSRVFWTAANSLGAGQIYVRVNAKNPTVAVSESVSKAAARFWTAAADGSKAIFTIDDGASPAESLYEFDVDEAQEHLIATEVEGVVGASDDGSRIYFVSREDLAAGASAGKPNLYLYEAGGGPGSYTFVATLVEGDVPASNNIPSPVSSEPYFHAARVGRDGEHAVFMTAATPTGYDSTDANSGQADSQVYLYDAGGNGGAGELLCISCNPTGARPVGRELLKGIGFGTGVWAAAQIPTFGSQLYGGRILSEDGERLFFESYEALVARDTNGRQDVYQWERGASRADCQAKGAELFVQSARGCLSLISSGASAKDSQLVDAGADGSDVFISTDSSLVSQDPGLIDIYDVRIGGGFPPPPPPNPPCEGEACQSPPPPPAEATPASSAFQGRGNVKSRKGGCAKGKRKVRRHGKAVCVKKQKRHGKRKQGRGGRAKR
jgi:hypothetical protein